MIALENDVRVEEEIPEGYVSSIGRKKRWSAFYVSEHSIPGNRHMAMCRYCRMETPGRPERLEAHIHVCRGIPEVQRQMYLNSVEIEKQSSTHKRKRKSISSKTNDNNIESDDSVGPHDGSNLGLTEHSFAGAMDIHSNNVDIALMEALLYDNIDLDAVERNPFFIKFIHSLRPNYVIPGVIDIENKLLPNIYNMQCIESLEKFQKCQSGTLIVEFYKPAPDVIALLTLAVLNTNEVRFVEIVDATNSASCMQRVLQCWNIYNVDIKKIQAVTCRHWNNALRHDLDIYCPFSISVPCAVECFERLLKKIIIIDEIKAHLNTCCSVFAFLMTSSVFAKSYTDHERASKYYERYNSITNIFIVLQYLINNEVTIRQSVRRNIYGFENIYGFPIIPPDIAAMISSETFFIHCVDICKLMEPLLHVRSTFAMNFAGGSNKYLCDVCIDFLKCYFQIEQSSIQEPVWKQCAISNLINGTGLLDDPVLIMALFLHPQYRNVASSGKYNFQVLMNILLSIAKKWGYSKDEAVILREEFRAYQQGAGPFISFEDAFGGNIALRTAMDYWDSVGMESSQELRKFAKKLLTLCSNTSMASQVLRSLPWNRFTKPIVHSKINFQHLNTMAAAKFEVYRRANFRFSAPADRARVEECLSCLSAIDNLQVPEIYVKSNMIAMDNVSASLDVMGNEGELKDGVSGESNIDEVVNLRMAREAVADRSTMIAPIVLMGDKRSGESDWDVDALSH